MSPLSGLVFECGETNLHEFLKNHPRTAVIEKINILESIVRSVSFLHKLNIVHFDLKPENVVLFNSNQGAKWKLIDFDSSFDLSDSSSRFVEVSGLRFTEEYVSPEVMRFVKPTSSSSSTTTTTTSSRTIEIKTSMDVWSVGVIAVAVFSPSRDGLWKMLHPESESFQSSMVSSVRQEDIENLLRREFGEKMKSFVGDCLQVEVENRRGVSELLGKSLFREDNSTISAKLSREAMAEICKEFKGDLQRFQAEGQEFVCGELDSRLSELIMNLRSGGGRK